VERAPADQVQEVRIRSSADGQLQPAWFYVPNQARCYKTEGEPVPLLVALHSWSSGYSHSSWKRYMSECRKFGFALIHPNFRGPNVSPSACASDLAVQDVLDAVEYAKNSARIDPRRVYLVGCSGGGHMALVMAHRAPHVWAAVSVWAAPTDLAAWYHQCENGDFHYVNNLESICGGPPGSAAPDAEYQKRSPLFHLAAARGVRLDLNAGIQDGHKGPTPISHTLRAFNALADANGHKDKVLSDAEIECLTMRRTVPASLADTWEADIRRETKVLFRRAAGPVRLTVFDGAHDIDYYAAVRWLAEQPARGAAEEPPATPPPVTHQAEPSDPQHDEG
jgi:poly(3-hydroxybutyrate) depolymerase